MPFPARRKSGADRDANAEAFDFTSHMRRLCDDISIRLPVFEHVDMKRVGIGFSQTRAAVRHGLQATLTPLRFAGGQRSISRGGRTWTVEQIVDPFGIELLYLLNFYLPRFLDLRFHEKLSTVIHELWHIGPRFDGDLRRHRGRCFAHGRSIEGYDAAMHRLADDYLVLGPPEEVVGFLRFRFRDLSRRYGAVVGHRYRAPKLIPLQESEAD